MPIIDIFASSEKIQNAQLSIECKLPAFRAGRQRLLHSPPHAQSQRAKTPPRSRVCRDAKTTLALSAISWLQFRIFKSLSRNETLRRRIAVENVHDHLGKRSRTFGQMILNVWVNDPERLVKRSRTFSGKNTMPRPKPFDTKEKVVS